MLSVTIYYNTIIDDKSEQYCVVTVPTSHRHKQTVGPAA